jgi:putative membrane protein insertion efficiency factor
VRLIVSIRGLPAQAIVGLILAYQKLVSPNLSTNCRYQPSCSQYVLEAVKRFGAMRGVMLGVRRIARCHPWHDGGFDPVPESFSASTTHHAPRTSPPIRGPR